MKRAFFITVVSSILVALATPAVAGFNDKEQGYQVGYRLGESDGHKDGRGPNCKLGPVTDDVKRERVAKYLKSQPDNELFGRGFRDGYAVGYDHSFLRTLRLQCKSKAKTPTTTEENQDAKSLPTSPDAGVPVPPDSNELTKKKVH